MRNQCSVDVNLEYAVSMISTGYATAEQAAQMCGIPLATLRTHVRQSPSAPAADAKALATVHAGESAATTRAGHAKSAVGALARNNQTAFAAHAGAAPRAPQVASLVPSATVYDTTTIGVLSMPAQ